jgi:hypothetical protein
MYTHISRLTTTNSNTYTSASQWHSEHGPCGVYNNYVIKGTIQCDGTGSVIRTLVYDNYSQRQLHSQSKRTVSKSFTQELIQEILS